MVPSSLLDLFARVQAQHRRDEQRERSKHFIYTFGYLLGCVLVLFLFKCHSRVYNALAGPFHLNLDQFVIQLDRFNEVEIDEHPPSIRWFSFHHEYFQVEIGENGVEQGKIHNLNVFSSFLSSGRLWYTFKRVKELNISVILHPDHLYIKLPSRHQHHFHSRLPYRFQSFSILTLRCIVRQLDVSPIDYMQWPEKSMYIQTIEQIYDQNATAFNIKVITKCGVFLGHLYRPEGERVYPSNSNRVVQFRKLDVALDASSPYYPYKTYLLSGVTLSWLLMKALVYVLLYLFHMIYRPALFIHPTVQNYLRQLRFDSLQMLNHFLLNISHEHNYRDRLFLVQNQYLLILNIDLNERNALILRQFHVLEPITIISLVLIKSVSRTGISVADGYSEKWISLPTIRSNEGDNGAEWLHERLMLVSEAYRRSYRGEQRRREQELIRAQEEVNRRRLTDFIHEEEERQRLSYENDFERICYRMTSASPRFIAEFRLKAPRYVNADLFNTRCTVCLTKFERGEHYAQWPCPAQHIFHHVCMLGVLRAQNTCPLCRHPVDSIELPDMETLARQIMTTIFFRVAT